MKILVVCQYYYPEEVRINEITSELVKRGHEVTVLTGLPNYPVGYVPREYKFFKNRKQVVNGVNVIRSFEIGRRKGIIFRILNYLSFAISSGFKVMFLKGDFDKVLVYQLSPITMVWPASIYKKLHKKKLVIYSLDLWPESIKTFGIKESSIIYKIIGWISKCMYKSADKILVSSKSFIEIISRRVNEKIDIEYLPQHAQEIKCEKNKKDKAGYDFVFAGNIGSAQSVETIIKAAGHLKENKNIKFHIVGDGSSLEDCKMLTKSLGLENVLFYGRKPQSEMKDYYSMADAMLVTLIDEEFCNRTMPAKVQSYMGAGKPIIAAINGETKEIIEESKTGICVNAEDDKALASAVLEYIELDDVKKREYAANSLEWYNKNYTCEKYIDKLLEELER